jgi:diguanylate cyclase (GGDEF)-like protein
LRGEGRDITGAIGVAVDITERKTFETRLVKQANTDALTGLPNMAHARDRLSEALAAADRSGRRLAVMFLDLDNFKNVNDSLGHSAGDKLLVETAARLGACLRGSDHIARLGGDEFLFLLEGAEDAEDAGVVARKLNRAMDRPFVVKGQELFVTASVGIAVYPDDGATPEALLQHADSALYGAKAAGRNTYRFFTHEMRTAAEERMAIESSLRRALGRGELSLRYQPILRLSDRAIVGAEALLRWHSPELGEVPPATFISVAEDAGLITAIGQWVLEEACREAVAWQSVAGRPIRLSANVSSRQFLAPKFLVQLRSALETGGLPPALLDLEITERLLVEDAPPTLALLNELAELGVRLALDDFGTGYSSLSYLARFPVHAIKIDRTFIHDLRRGGSATELVDAIIALAHNLRLEVIAEGVEIAEQLAYVADRGVELAQGYYIHPPLHAEDFRALLGGKVPSRRLLRAR